MIIMIMILMIMNKEEKKKLKIKWKKGDEESFYDVATSPSITFLLNGDLPSSVFDPVVSFERKIYVPHGPFGSAYAWLQSCIATWPIHLINVDTKYQDR